MSKLPKSWLEIPVSAIAEVNPPQPSIPIPEDGLVSFVRMASVEAESGILDASQLRPWAEVNKGYTKFQEGDVLFAKITPCMENGKSTIARELRGQIGAGSTEFHVLRTNGLVRGKYLLHFLLQRQVRRNARMLMQGAAGQLRVPASFFDRLVLQLAPPEEQDRIVAEIEKQFTRLDAATAALKRVQANLKRYRASILKAACEGRLVPTETELARKEGRDYEPADKLLQRILRERRARWEAETLAKMIGAGRQPTDDRWKQKYKEPSTPDTTNLPELPEGWCWANANQITTLVTDGEHITPPRTASGVYLLSARNVRDGELSLEEVDYISAETYAQLSVRLPIVAGDVLLSCSGSVGRSCVVPTGVSFSLVRSVAVLKSLVVHPDYLSFALRSRFVQDQIRQKSTQTAQSNIFQAQIKSLILPIPPLCEQDRIVAAGTRFTEEIVRCELGVKLSSTRASSLRQAILRHAFAGQLVPQDPTDEPASALLERIRAERVESSKKTAAGNVPRMRGKQ
jgi:type I restriction enzyme S subunit